MSYKTLKILFVFHERPKESIEELIYSFNSQAATLDISTEFPTNPNDYSLVVLWNYQKKIVLAEPRNNIIVFHSSDLPRGRGWAPIAQLFLQEIPVYTLTAIFIDANIDTGRMILKATFPIKNSMTARQIRVLDEWLTVFLSLEIARELNERRIMGIPQVEANASYYPRRYSSQSQINPADTFESVIPLLRAAEEGHECFFLLGDTTYLLKATPMENAIRQVNVEVTYLSTNEIKQISLQLDSESLRVFFAP